MCISCFVEIQWSSNKMITFIHRQTEHHKNYVHGSPFTVSCCRSSFPISFRVTSLAWEQSRLSQCGWSNPDECGWINHMDTGRTRNSRIQTKPGTYSMRSTMGSTVQQFQATSPDGIYVMDSQGTQSRRPTLITHTFSLPSTLINVVQINTPKRHAMASNMPSAAWITK